MAPEIFSCKCLFHNFLNFLNHHCINFNQSSEISRLKLILPYMSVDVFCLKSRIKTIITDFLYRAFHLDVPFLPPEMADLSKWVFHKCEFNCNAVWKIRYNVNFSIKFRTPVNLKKHPHSSEFSNLIHSEKG